MDRRQLAGKTQQEELVSQEPVHQSRTKGRTHPASACGTKILLPPQSVTFPSVTCTTVS
eukprot:SAG22_NODE_21061_length_260_cov_0.850932_1_plen_58_part_10